MMASTSICESSATLSIRSKVVKLYVCFGIDCSSAHGSTVALRLRVISNGWPDLLYCALVCLSVPPEMM